MGLFTVSRYGVLGMLITLIFDGVPSIVIGLIFVKKRYNTTIVWVASGKIILSSAVAAFLSYFVVKLPFASLIQLIIGLAIFLSSFIVMIVLTRTLSKNDIVNLREMASSLGPLGKIVNTFLTLIEKLMALSNTQPKT